MPTLVKGLSALMSSSLAEAVEGEVMTMTRFRPLQEGGRQQGRIGGERKGEAVLGLKNWVRQFSLSC